MVNAVFMPGNAKRFYECVVDFRRYLLYEKLTTFKKTKILQTTYIDEVIFEYYLSRAIAAKTKEPLLIVFCGHGSNYGWALDDLRIFHYSQLAHLLSLGKRPITLLNDCCHAMAATETFSSRVSSERLSFIAASEADETTIGGRLLEFALDSWKQGKPVRFGRELRWGAQFDHHYYGKNINESTEVTTTDQNVNPAD